MNGKKLLFLALAFTLVRFAANASPSTHKLLPGLSPVPAIQFSLPSDFIAAYPTEKPDLKSGIFWGNKEDLISFFEKPKERRGAVIQVKMSSNVRQWGNGGFEREESMVRDMTNSGYKNVKIRKLNWGVHPVLAFEGETSLGDEQHIAWLGLNAQNGATLRISLINVTGQKKSDPVHLAFWENFLAKTKDRIVGGSQDKETMQIRGGSVYLKQGSAELKAQAQRRQRDTRLVVLVEPLNDATYFELGELREARPTWADGKSMVKVYGEVIHRKGEGMTITPCIIPIEIQEVEDFSPDTYQAQQNKRNILIIR